MSASDSMPLLSGRRAIVTGGGQGIGQAIPTRMAGHGGTTSLLDRNGRLVEPAAARMPGGVHAGFASDVTDAAQEEAAFDEAVTHLEQARAAAGDARFTTSKEARRGLFPPHRGQPAAGTIGADLLPQMPSSSVRPRCAGFHGIERRDDDVLQRFWDGPTSLEPTADAPHAPLAGRADRHPDR